MFPRWSYEATVMRHRPIAFWPLGDAHASRLRRFGGVQTTALTFSGTRTELSPAAPGIVSKAQSFASGASVRDVDLENLSGSPVSFTAWVRWSSVAQVHLFGAYQPSSPWDGWGIGLGIVTNNGGLAYLPGAGAWKQSAAAVPADAKWHHVAYVVTGAGDFIGYVDGIAAASVSAGLPDSYTGRKAIAARADGAQTLSGGLTCPAVWNRALSATEVTDQFRAGRSPSIPSRHRLIR